MRGRAYRRYMMEVKVINRLKRIRGYSRLKDANHVLLDSYTWVDLIGTHFEWMFKTYTTCIYDTRYKQKWGLKSKKRLYRDSGDPRTRSYDKKRFIKELELNEGYKHFPTYTRPKFELEDSK